MDSQRISQLIAELDELVPRSAALVRIDIDDVVEEGEPLLAGNRAGYLRLGVELLKLADAPPQHNCPDRVQADLTYLLDPETHEGQLATFVRREDIRPRLQEETARRQQTGERPRVIVAIVGIALAAFLVVSLVVGGVHVVRWLATILSR